jgi:predicted AAA+ superfamily ATPase
VAKKSNKSRVGDSFDYLEEVLRPFIRKKLKDRFRGAWYDRFEQALERTLSLQKLKGDDEETRYASADLHALMTVMDRLWWEVFSSVLPKTARSHLNEIREYRNQWAHPGGFTIQEADRAIQTVYLLMEVLAPAHLDEITKLLREVQLERFEEDERKFHQAQTIKIAADADLPSWKKVAIPHENVSSGESTPADYAADLSQVVAGSAPIEYQHPVEFFRRTYITEGLRQLLQIALRRLTGRSAEPIVQLQTSFGGGKTHTMLALYHLFGDELDLKQLPELQELVAEIDDDIPIANRAVIVGTNFSQFEPRKHADGVCTYTLWGEMAHQLGGKEAYELVRQEDEHGISPSSEKIRLLFERFGPALVLIDEWVAFARNIYNKTDLPCGSFDSNLTFVQALTEGAKQSSDALVVASIPESDIEIGGDDGQAVREQLEHTFGRVEVIWKPASREESMEIVRRRLFREIDEVKRHRVITAFMDLYRKENNAFPQETQHWREYQQKMLAAYPIHPELFNRLYEDWSTLERFQRTRGVLRLMANMIHHLWTEEDPSPLIMPSTLPLDWSPAVSELIKYLPNEGWDSVVETDVDGQSSRAYRLDVENSHFGACSACRRVARTIFLGSAPKDKKKNNRGLDEARIRLGCVQPGESIIVFNDALRRLQEEMAYVYTDSQRYWFDTHPSINRLARDMAQEFDEQEHILPELKRRLKEFEQQRYHFAKIQTAPEGSSEVPDEQEVRLVVLPPNATHRKRNLESKALQQAEEILLQRGDTPRLNRNMLLFLATDATRIEHLKQQTRLFLAWRELKQKKEQYNLDSYQKDQVNKNLENLNHSVRQLLDGAYEWVFVPKEGEKHPVDWDVYRLSTVSGENCIAKASRKLTYEEELIMEWSPARLNKELEKWIWKNNSDVSLQKLWSYYTQYLYLSRLRDQEVLRQAIIDGLASQDYFGYAQAKDEKGRYQGFIYHELGARVYIDQQSLLIEPNVAKVVSIQREEEQKQTQQTAATRMEMQKKQHTFQSAEQGSTQQSPKPKLVQKRYQRMNGIASIPPERVMFHVNQLWEEIIQLLVKIDQAELDIRLDLEVKVPAGLPEHVVRAVRENAHQLGVRVEFYEE